MIRFKYSELSSWLKEQIENGNFQSGQKIPSEMELAKKFSISRDTVRKCLAILEKENLLYKIKGSGTYVRKLSLEDGPVIKFSDSRTIGIVMADINNYIFPDIVKGINTVLLKNGYRAAIHFTNNRISQERVILKELMAGEFSGYIIEPTKSGLLQANFDLYQKIANITPAVLIHAKIPTLSIDSITMGDETAGFKVTSYLLNQGFRNIVFIGKFDDQTGLKRYLGYIKAYQDMKLKIPDENIFWCATEEMERLFTEKINPSMAAALMNCEAVICQDDRLAICLKRFIQIHNEFPKDMIICGFDDSLIAQSEHIISVAHPKKKFGEYVALRLLDKIRDSTINVSFDFNPKLIVR